ncbi:MAG: transposase, partial [Anaerolineae bacterium]|nr:transposase [Anaerolineae bacterium]
MVWAEVGGMKIGIRLEIQRGQMQGCLLDLKSNDQKASVIDNALPAGSLHLADLGLFKLERFQRWDKHGVYWLTRYKAGVKLYDEHGQPLALASLLHGDQAIRLPVRVGGGRHQVRAQLLAAPLPPDALAKREARLKEQARLDQRPLSPQQREIAGWTIYLTNVPDLSFE